MIFWTLLPTAILAFQALAQGTNLTVTFFPNTSDTCATDNPADALIFNMVGVFDKKSDYCFNVEDLVRDSKPSISDGSISDGSLTVQSDSTPGEFSWRLLNTNAYPADTAYSRILYNQQNITSPSPGEGGEALFAVYSGQGCQANYSLPHNGYPTLWWSCQSSVEGDCYEVPHNILSIRVSSAVEVNRDLKRCVTRSSTAAKGIGSGSTAAIMGTVIMLVAGVLSW